MQFFDHAIDARKALPLLESLRSALIRIAVVTVTLAVAGYFLAEPILAYLHRITQTELVAYGIADTFFSTLKIALAVGVMAGMPYTLYALFATVPRHFPNFSRKAFVGFWAASMVLFATGVIFCLKITLPFGIQFLLSFETTDIVALISIRKFVSFCFWVIFGFGLIFELPLFMMLLARIGIVDAKRLGRYRRYAIVVILIVAAVLTPTPDVLNLLLMAGPLYLLFEIGLVGMKFSGGKKDE
ncbi:MAG: hypothetical protein VR64_05065 [Desulfatitalea sp. BRH_c12]|nr:MAG: hypothetical protein VR64_05065 [Desulfatitalea sp. BRH_c12]